MYKKSNKLTKAQTALEYIAASLVFATVGIGLFLGANQAAVLSTRGTQDNYGSGDTLLGKTLEDGIADGDRQWPEDWSQPQEGLGGALPEDTAEAGVVHQVDWEDAQEYSFLAGTGAGEHWIDPEDSRSGIELDYTDGSPTAEEVQADYSDYTEQWVNLNNAGYTQEGLDGVNQDLDQDWFMGSVEE